MKKRILSILLCFCMAISLLQGITLPAAAASIYFSNGDGTLENPYKITTPEQLKYMADSYSDKNGVNRYYVLQNNIDMSGTGTGIDSFSGIFNGNGYTISNLNGRLVATNFGTIRNVVLKNPSYTGLTTPPQPEDQMGNYDREIETISNGTTYYTQDSKNHAVTYFFKEKFGFAAGTNERSGVIDNVTVTGGKIKAYYENNSLISDTNDFYYGMVRYAPGRMGGVVGYNNVGVISNCTVQNLTVNSDSALGVFGGTVGYNYSGTVVGCVTKTVQVKKAGGFGTWTDSDKKTSVHCWAVGAIVGYAYGKNQSCYSEDTHCYASDSTSTGDLPAMGFRKAASIFDVNTGDSTVLGQDEAHYPVGYEKLSGSANVAMNVTTWNALVDAGTYPGLKKRDTSNYLKVLESSDISDEVEVRYYDNNGKLLSTEQKTRNSLITLSTYTESVQGEGETRYLNFVDQYKVTKTANGATVNASKPGDTITLDGSIDVKWAMPLKPYVTYSVAAQQGTEFALKLSLYNDSGTPTPIEKVYTSEQLTELKNSITVNYTKDNNTSTSVTDGAYGNYTVTLDTSKMTYPSMLRNRTSSAQLWHIGPLTSQQAPIANTLNGYTGNVVNASIPVLKNSGVNYEVWYEGTSGTTYAASTTAPTEIGNYNVSVKNVGVKLDGKTYAECWQTTEGPVVLGTMSISSSGLTVFTNGSDTPSKDSKFAVSYTSGGEQKSISFSNGSSSIATGSIPADATDVALKYDAIVVKSLANFNPATPYRFDLVKLTVYNAAEGNLKGDTSISDNASISGYNGILQFWVEKGTTLGDFLTKKPKFGVLTFSSWVDGENTMKTYPESTPINSAMAVAAKYTDSSDQSGFVVGENYYFFDDDFGFVAVNPDLTQTINHYLGYYGGTVRSNVGSVAWDGTSGTYGTYTPGSQAQARRLFITPANVFFAREEVSTTMNKYRNYLLSGQIMTNGIQRLPSNNYDAQNGYADGNGFWRVNPWNDRTQLFVNLGADKAGVPSGAKELGLYRNGGRFSYSADNNVVGLSSNNTRDANYLSRFDKSRMYRLVYDMDMSVTKSDYWQINLHLLDGALWNFGKQRPIANPTPWTLPDREIHYIATKADTKSLQAPSVGTLGGQITLDTAKLSSIVWRDKAGKYYFPGDAVPRGTKDLYMVDANQLLNTLKDEAACTAVGLDSSYIGYYPIKTAADLKLLSDVINAMSEFETKTINAVLLNDLDMSVVPDWCPIGYTGSSQTYYSGVFDGNGYSISNLNSTRGGLFYITYDITIKNLTIASGNIDVSDNDAGAFLNYIRSGSGHLINCANYATINGTGHAQSGIGGLAGVAGVYPMTFERCYNFGSVTGNGKYLGNIFGVHDGISSLHAAVTITDCYGVGNLYGGMRGNYLDAINVTNSYFGVNAERLANGEVAWLLNTKNGTEANCGFWSQSVTHPVFANGTNKLPAYRITFSGDGFTTAYAYTNEQGTVISMPESVSGKLLTYDTDKTFTVGTKVTSDLTVKVADAGDKVTTAPSFAENGNTYTMQDSAPKNATFTLAIAPTVDTAYAIYSAANGGVLMGTVVQSDTKLTVTLNSAPTAASTTYYIAAQENGKAESVRTAVTCTLKPEPEFTNAITDISANYGDAPMMWNNSLKIGDGIITFQSSDTNVAEVGTDGALTIKGVGTADVTVSVAEGQNNRAQNFLYKITVSTKNVQETRTQVNQSVVEGKGTFTQPAFDNVTGTLTYGWNSETGKNYEEVVTYLKTLAKGAMTTINYSYAANGNYTGNIIGTIAMTVINVEFTGDGLAMAATPTYGDMWSDTLKLDSSKYSAKLGDDIVSGSYRMQVKNSNDTAYADMPSSDIPAAGNYDYQVLFSSMDNIVTDMVVTSGSITVAQRVAELTWGNTLLTYNGSVQAPTAEVSNKVGTDAVTVIVAGGQTGVGSNYTATADSLEGASKDNYKLSDIKPTQSFSIVHAISTLLWEGNAEQSTIYTGSAAAVTAPKVTPMNGETYSGTISYSYKAQGSVGEYTSGLPADVGTWLIKAHMSSSGNYAAADSADMTLTITSAPLSITGAMSTDRAYNGTTAVKVSGGTLSGILNNDEVILVSSGATGTMADANAGLGKNVTVNGYALSGAKAANYTVTQPTDVTVNISKAIITVTADNKIIVKGAGLPTDYTATYTGFVGSDTRDMVIKTNAVLTCSAIDINTVASYSITPSGGEFNADYEKNYQFGYADGTLSIIDKTPVAITDLIAPANRIYNGSAIADSDFGIPVFTPGTYTGAGLTYTYYVGNTTTGSAISAPKDAGTYTVRVAIPDSNRTYAGYADITFTIGKATVTAIADSKGMTAGGKLPAFTVSYRGIVAGDTAESIFVTQATASCAADGKAPGKYDITVTDPILTKEAADNYTVGASVKGMLTVSYPSTDEGGSSSGSTTSSASTNGPSSVSTTTNTVSVLVSSHSGKVNVSAYVSGTTATVSATDAQIKEIASSTENTGTVKVDVSGQKVNTVIVPIKLVSAVNRAYGFAGLEIVLPTGVVTLDKTALASVADKDDIKISVETVSNSNLTDRQKTVLGNQVSTAVVVDVNVYVGGNKTSTFNNGEVKVSIPYTLKSGENADSITVWFIKNDGSIEPKNGTYNTATGCVEFTTEHLSQYAIVSFPFTDVAEASWYYGSVAYACNNGLFSGTSATTFSPNAAMTRQMIWMVLAHMDGKLPTNMDEARIWAIESGISDGSNPRNSITREQMATILYHYAQYKGYDTTQGGMVIREFVDYDDISEYALPALAWVVNIGLMQGSDNHVMPSENATRAQVATILMHFLQNVAK